MRINTNRNQGYEINLVQKQINPLQYFYLSLLPSEFTPNSMSRVIEFLHKQEIRQSQIRNQLLNFKGSRQQTTDRNILFIQQATFHSFSKPFYIITLIKQFPTHSSVQGSQIIDKQSPARGQAFQQSYQHQISGQAHGGIYQQGFGQFTVNQTPNGQIQQNFKSFSPSRQFIHGKTQSFNQPIQTNQQWQTSVNGFIPTTHKESANQVSFAQSKTMLTNNQNNSTLIPASHSPNQSFNVHLKGPQQIFNSSQNSSQIVSNKRVTRYEQPLEVIRLSQVERSIRDKLMMQKEEVRETKYIETEKIVEKPVEKIIEKVVYQDREDNSKIDHLEQMVLKYKQEIDMLKQAIDGQKIEIEKQDENIDYYKNLVVDLEHQLQTANDRIQENGKLINKHQQLALEYKTELGDEKQKSEKKLNEKKNEIEELEKKIKELKRDVKDKNGAISDKDDEIEDWKQKYNKLFEGYEELQEVTTRTETITQELNTWKNKFIQVNRDYHQVQEEYMLCQAELENLKKQFKGSGDMIKKSVVESHIISGGGLSQLNIQQSRRMSRTTQMQESRSGVTQSKMLESQTQNREGSPN